MKKLKIVLICTILLLGIVALLYFIPWPTPIELTLNAVKLDSSGNEIATTQIYIEGHKLQYLFREERILLTINPFDDLSQIEDAKVNGERGHIIHIGKEAGTSKYLRLHFNAKNSTKQNSASLILTFSDNMECFAFHIDPYDMENDSAGETVYYVASVSGNYTTSELIAYFNGLVPGQ